MKLGIALGGGGMRGAAHVGVLRVFESEKISPVIVTGTSAGALYAAGKSAEHIAAVLGNLRALRWFARERTGLGLFSTDGIRRILDAEIGAGARIENLPRRFACVAVDLAAQEEKIFTAGSVADAVCASVAFPGFFAPVALDGRYYADGGILNPVPFDVARRLGATRVIAVDLGALEDKFPAFEESPRQSGGFPEFIFRTITLQKIYGVVDRAVSIMERALTAQKKKHSPPDLVIAPRLAGVGLIDFDKRDRAYRAGINAARAALPAVRALAQPAYRLWWRRVRRARKD